MPKRVKRTTKLTIETRRVLVCREPRISRELWCEACGEAVRFVTPPEAAALANTGQRTIYRLVEAGKIHFIETDEASLRICFNSLCDRLLQADARHLSKS